MATDDTNHDEAPLLENAAELLGPRRLRTEIVYIAAFEKRVRISELTGAEARKMSDLGESKDKLFLPKVAQMALVNADGEKFYRDDQVKALADLSFDGLQEVVNHSMRLSGLTKKDAKPGEAGAVAS